MIEVEDGVGGEKSVIMHWRTAEGRKEEGGEVQSVFVKEGGNALGAGGDGVMHKKWIRNEGKSEVEAERGRRDGRRNEVTRISQEQGLKVDERFLASPPVNH